MSNKQSELSGIGTLITLVSQMEEEILSVKWDNLPDDLVVDVKLDGQTRQEKLTK